PHGMIDSFFNQLTGWATALDRIGVHAACRRAGGAARSSRAGDSAKSEGHNRKLAGRPACKGTRQAAKGQRPLDHAVMEGSMARMRIHADRADIDTAARAAKRLIRDR